jgi:PAS domain S-box-containing protein
MAWQNIALTILIVFSATASAGLAFFGWLRRRSPCAPQFCVLMAGVTIWSLSYALQLAASELSLQNFFALIKYVGIVLVSPAFLTFALAYAGKNQWLNSRTLILLAIEPAAALFLLFTNDFHGLMWTRIRSEEVAGFQVRITSPGLLFWIHACYGYILLIAGCYFLIRTTLRRGAFFRSQSLAVVIAILVPLLGNVLYLTRLNPFYPFDLTPFSFFISGLGLGYSIFRHRLLDALPIAHEVVIRNMKDGLIVLDPSNHILEINPSAQSFVDGHSRDLIGRPVSQIFSNRSDLLRTFASSAESQPAICPDPKGSRFYEIQPTLLRSPKGKLVGRLLVLHDITEALLAEEALKRANEELEKRVLDRTSELQRTNQRLREEAQERQRAQEVLRESDELYRQIVEQPFDGIYLQREGKIIFINQTGAKLLAAKNPGEVVGKSVLDFIHPDYREFVARRIERISREGNPVALAQEKFICFDGREIDVEVAGTALHYGGVLSTLVVFRDITERKTAEDQIKRAKQELEVRVQDRTAALAQTNLSLHQEIAERERVERELRISKEEAEAANRAKSTFLANMSHELRTPLNAIIGFSELMADGQTGELNGTQKEYMEDVLQSSRHLLSLINDILDLSKVEAGKMELEIKDVSLRAIVERSLTMVKEKALKHEIGISQEMNGIPDPIEADERKLKQVLFNLVSNAVKFTPDRGQVRIRGDLISMLQGSWLRKDGGV